MSAFAEACTSEEDEGALTDELEVDEALWKDLEELRHTPEEPDFPAFGSHSSMRTPVQKSKMDFVWNLLEQNGHLYTH